MRAASLLLAFAAAMAGKPGLAEGGPKSEEVAAFVAAVKTAGCHVAPDNTQQIIKASGLTPEVAAAAAQRLEDEGKLVIEADKTLTLVPELCK